MRPFSYYPIRSRPALLLGLWLLFALAPWVSPAQVPQPYDPPGAVVTTDKATTPQARRTFAFPEAGVFVDNRFDGARLNDVIQVNDTTYTAIIHPENVPINNSAWYAFRLWAPTPRPITVNVHYENGTHRYVPKLSTDGHTWTPIDPSRYALDPTVGTARLHLNVGPDTLWVAAQELVTSSTVEAWMDSLAALPFVTRGVIGRSREGRPIWMLTVTTAEAPADYVLLIGRQHPPEVTGSLALQAFLETITGDTPLARRFRARFAVWAVPLVNPDGVDHGHWRHNAAGVDLNRDWLAFNQPETRAVRDRFLQLNESPQHVVHTAVDFHSTQEDIFYTLDRSLEAFPAGFVDRWLDTLQARLPDYLVTEEADVLGSPISKNWFYEAFGATPMTYEVGDEVSRPQIRRVARTAAETMMALLLEE